MPHPVRHADALERFHHALLAVGRRHLLPVGERQFDVLVHREIADQVETLEDESDLLVADARALCEVQVLDRLAVQQVAPVGGRVQQADDREQRGLAAARRARHGHVLAFVDGQVHAGKRVRLNLIGVEDFGHLLDLDKRLLSCSAIAVCLVIV